MYRILELNPQLQDFAGDIDLRMSCYENTKKRLLPIFSCAIQLTSLRIYDNMW